MKIFFDHNVPRKLRAELPSHFVSNAFECGWAELENGTLLRAVEDDGFELMLTCDQNLAYQQNLKGRKLAIVVLATNDWRYLKSALPLILSAVSRAVPGSFEEVQIRRPQSRPYQRPEGS